jgi:hypothetical protein
MALVFISHSSKDRDFVEGEVIPFLKSIGVDAWYSKDDIERICLKCLAIQLHERYATAKELAEGLLRFHRGASVSRARRWFWPFSR